MSMRLINVENEIAHVFLFHKPEHPTQPNSLGGLLEEARARLIPLVPPLTSADLLGTTRRRRLHGHAVRLRTALHGDPAGLPARHAPLPRLQLLWPIERRGERPPTLAAVAHLIRCELRPQRPASREILLRDNVAGAVDARVPRARRRIVPIFRLVHLPRDALTTERDVASLQRVAGSRFELLSRNARLSPCARLEGGALGPKQSEPLLERRRIRLRIAELRFEASARVKVDGFIDILLDFIN